MRLSRSHFLVLIFFGMSLFGVLRHELSLDEARPWVIVSETPVAKIVSETRCEMHCLPWFFLVKGLSTISSHPLAMQIFGVILGTLAFGVLALFSPFGFLEKCLLLFNYYLFFEFNLIARPYALMTLGLFLVSATFHLRGTHPLRFFSSILVLTHSTYFGIFLTLPFTVLYLFELLRGGHSIAAKNLRIVGIFLILYLGSLIWYAIPLSSSYGCVDLSLKNLPVNFARITETTWDLARAFYILGTDTWNEHLFDYHPAARGALSLLWFLSVIGITWSLRKSPRVAFLFGSSLVLFFSYRFTKPVYYGNFLRHLGALSLMYIACMWVARRELASGVLSRVIFLLFLSCGAYSGLRLFSEDLARPFSSGPEVHEFISRPEYRTAEIIPDSLLFSSAYLVYSRRSYLDYLRSPATKARYYPISADFRPVFVVPAQVRGRHIVPKVREEVFRWAITQYVTAESSSLVIINYPARAGYMEELGLELLQAYDNAINPNENYYIYAKAR